jgi:hypothetical protein
MPSHSVGGEQDWSVMLDFPNASIAHSEGEFDLQQL